MWSQVCDYPWGNSGFFSGLTTENRIFQNLSAANLWAGRHEILWDSLPSLMVVDRLDLCRPKLTGVELHSLQVCRCIGVFMNEMVVRFPGHPMAVFPIFQLFLSIHFSIWKIKVFGDQPKCNERQPVYQTCLAAALCLLRSKVDWQAKTRGRRTQCAKLNVFRDGEKKKKTENRK